LSSTKVRSNCGGTLSFSPIDIAVLVDIFLQKKAECDFPLHLFLFKIEKIAGFMPLLFLKKPSDYH